MRQKEGVTVDNAGGNGVYGSESNGNGARSRRRPRALVTGGAGFIGSHLSELLLEEGWEVFALDDLSTGTAENVAGIREQPGFHLVVDSVLSRTVVSELVHRCDVVF